MGLRKRNKLVYGVGVNNADYMTQKYEIINGKSVRIRKCPFYRTWTGMLRRCYSDKYHQTKPTYKGCTVCDEWLTFSNFKSWMEEQDWQGKQIDKDILVEGNKVYCPEYCIFVDRRINLFVTDRSNDRGEYMLGVSWKKDNGKFQANCSNSFTGKLEFLGLFTDELQAHLAWKARKHELACQLAESEYCNDPRLTEVLKTKYIGGVEC